jgi:hypothetical protein
VSHEDNVNVLLAVNFLECLLIDISSLFLLDSIDLSGSRLLLASGRAVTARAGARRGLARGLSPSSSLAGLLARLLDSLGSCGLLAVLGFVGRFSLGGFLLLDSGSGTGSRDGKNFCLGLGRGGITADADNLGLRGCGSGLAGVSGSIGGRSLGNRGGSGLLRLLLLLLLLTILRVSATTCKNMSVCRLQISRRKCFF